MSENFTAKDVDMVSYVLLGEEMACKKARVYSKTLTDVNLAEKMGFIADAHERRFNELFKLLSGGKN